MYAPDTTDPELSSFAKEFQAHQPSWELYVC